MLKAVVTGHSGGLGAAIADQLRQRGWRVLGVSRTASGPEDVALDLGDLESLEQWLDAGALAEFVSDASRVLLVNNAGVLAPVELVGRQPFGEIARAVAVNVTAPLALTNAVVAARPAGARLQVVHISSGAARRAYPGWSVYCATKAALDLHAEALASEGHQGLSVVSLAPGVVDTEMQAQIRASEQFPIRDRFVELHAKGQLTAPDETASKIVAFLETESFGKEVRTDVREL